MTINLPYSRQWINEADIQTVANVLRSEWLTTGPKVKEFEQAIADFVGADEAVAVCNGTAALHAAMYAAEVGQDDEVIVPPLTFPATVNAVLYQSGIPVFADVSPDTLLIDPEMVADKITARTKAIIAVDYAGHPCDYQALRQIAEKNRLALISDACHSLGAEYRKRKVGTLADITVFSFHPVKHITTGEGGMITTDDEKFAHRMRLFRNHGISTDHHQREKEGSWFYEMTDLGYNYRITDFQCALGMSQLAKLPGWIARRQEIAKRYHAAFYEMPAVEPLGMKNDISHAFHLYVVKLDLNRLEAKRSDIFSALRAKGIGANVHYIPVHLHPFYRKNFHTARGLCPVAEDAYEQIISLPMFPHMSDHQVEIVISTLEKIVTSHLK